jgi:flavin reductase (DIM6/NTAB) family NADH-FMN oxidoreductase RutF
MIFCNGSDIVAYGREGSAILMHGPRPGNRPVTPGAGARAALLPSNPRRIRADTVPPPASRRARPATGAFTGRQFRDALAQFATGVTIIAARRSDGRYVGFTANSFNSVSLEPPLVVWSLDRRAECLAAFESAERYSINVLAHDQVELARRFSRPHVDRFSGVRYRLGAADAPLIDGSIAWFECRHHARYRAGDHLLFIGEVETCERRSGRGLTFHHGRYGATGLRK